MRALAIALLVLGGAAIPAAAAPPSAAPGGELLVMNDGIWPVTGVRLRPAGEVDHAAWTGDLLEGEPVPVGEGRRIDLSALGLGCEVELEVTVEGRAGPVAGQQSVCADPRFWMGFALGLDAPGTGAPTSGYEIQAWEPDEEVMMWDSPAAGPIEFDPDPNRGLPVCPGDPRCKKKK